MSHPRRDRAGCSGSRASRPVPDNLRNAYRLDRREVEVTDWLSLVADDYARRTRFQENAEHGTHPHREVDGRLIGTGDLTWLEGNHGGGGTDQAQTTQEIIRTDQLGNETIGRPHDHIHRRVELHDGAF